MTTNRTPWQDTENGQLAGMYFIMLDAAHINQPANKAGMIRHYRGEALGAWLDGHTAGTLSARSRGSIEFKLMNASAAHADILAEGTDHPASHYLSSTMHGHGYRALPNYQASLKQAMLEAIAERQLDADIATAAANEQRAGA